MAITLATATSAMTAAGTTSAAPTFNGTTVAGDLIVFLVGNKPFSSTPTSSDGAYTQQGTIASGAVANGVSTGSTRSTIFTKVALGSDTAPTANVTSGSPAQAILLVLNGSLATGWDLAATTGADTDETGTAVSITGAADPGFQAGDYLVMALQGKDDLPVWGTRTPAIPGCTITSITNTGATTTTGNDGVLYRLVYSVDTGTSSGVPTFTATSDTAGASSLPAVFVRVREAGAAAPAIPPILVMAPRIGP